MKQSRSHNTNRAYQADWKDFTSWCGFHQLTSLPAEPATIALYLSARADFLKVSTLQRRLVAIRQAHRLSGHYLDLRHPHVTEVWKGIRKKKGSAQIGKRPIVVEELRLIVACLDVSKLRGVRDKAMLLLGFAAALRRSELVSLDVGDVVYCEEGLKVILKRSKTDQEGVGREIGVPKGLHVQTCPVRALRDWMEASRIIQGPLFRGINRHGQIARRWLCCKSVALIVKRAAGLLGGVIEKTDSFDYVGSVSGHSLRAGLATSAAMAGVAEHTIMRQTGHKKAETLRKYIRMGTLFTDNAAGQVGL